jgi:hypothetical protein
VAMWAAAVDGATRPSAVIGAAACLGLLVAEPLIRVLARRSPLTLLPEQLPGPLWVAPVALVHLGLVFVASRVAGIRATVAEASVVVALTALAVVGIGLFLRVNDRHERPAGSSS